MTDLEQSQTIAALRRENHLLHRIIERARTYRGTEGWACPLCSYENGVFIERCEPHQQMHKLISQCIDAYTRLCAGDYEGARILLDNVTKFHRGPDAWTRKPEIDNPLT